MFSQTGLVPQNPQYSICRKTRGGGGVSSVYFTYFDYFFGGVNNGIPLATSSFTKDLGVAIDPDLEFDLHINDLVARGKQRAAIIHICFISRNTGNLIRAFKLMFAQC